MKKKQLIKYKNKMIKQSPNVKVTIEEQCVSDGTCHCGDCLVRKENPKFNIVTFIKKNLIRRY